MKSIEADEKDRPLCPWCAKELREVKAHPLDKRGFLRVIVKYVYSCPHCRKVLGVGNWSLT